MAAEQSVCALVCGSVIFLGWIISLSDWELQPVDRGLEEWGPAPGELHFLIFLFSLACLLLSVYKYSTLLIFLNIFIYSSY